MPVQNEPQASDQSQDSEPLSEGSLSASSGAGRLSSAQDPHHRNAGPSISSTDRGANTSQAETHNSSSSRDETDCLLDLVIDSVAPPPNLDNEIYVRRDDSDDALNSLQSDNPPSYSDVSTIVPALDKSKPPRYKTAIQNFNEEADKNDDDITQSSDEEEEGSLVASNSNGNLSYGDQPALRIGINLLRASKRLLDFLSVVSAQPKLYSKDVTKAAIYRLAFDSAIIK